MPTPKATQINLTSKQVENLLKLVRGHKTGQQIVKRAKIILYAGDKKTNSWIAKELNTTIGRVSLWRDRWASFAEIPLEELTARERLEDAPRSGAPAKITAEQRCQIEKLACEQPQEYGVPISQWSNKELAAEIMRQNIVDSISPRHAGRLLKRSRYKTSSN